MVSSLGEGTEALMDQSLPQKSDLSLYLQLLVDLAEFGLSTFSSFLSRKRAIMTSDEPSYHTSFRYYGLRMEWKPNFFSSNCVFQHILVVHIQTGLNPLRQSTAVVNCPPSLQLLFERPCHQQLSPFPSLLFWKPRQLLLDFPNEVACNNLNFCRFYQEGLCNDFQNKLLFFETFFFLKKHHCN